MMRRSRAVDRLPVVGRVVVADAVEVDQAGVRLGAVADEAAVARLEVDREGEAAGDVRRRRSTSRSAASRRAQRGVVEDGVAAAEADLVEPHARADQHREGARRDLGVERAGVAGLDAVELGAAVGDQPGEEVEPAGRALGVGDRRDRRRAAPGPRPAARRRRSPSPAPRRRARSMRCISKSASRSATRGAAAGQEGGAHPEGLAPEAEVEARRLDLAGRERRRGGDRAVGEHARDALGRDHAGPGSRRHAGVWSG